MDIIIKTVILNGSPKGNESLTLMFVKFLQKHFPQITAVTYDVSAQSTAIQNNIITFNKIIMEIANADLIIFCFPVYNFHIPSQFMEFFELVNRNKCSHVFKNKFSAIISTSNHLFDNIACNHIRALSDDYRMKFVGMHLALSEDFLNLSGRQALLNFGKYLIFSVDNDIFAPREFIESIQIERKYQPTYIKNEQKTNEKKIIILVDDIAHDSSLANMIRTFQKFSKSEIQIISLKKFKFAGGCNGCLNCLAEGQCFYNDKFDIFYKRYIETANCILIAAEISEHYIGSTFKIFFDRQNFVGYRQSISNIPIGYILSGGFSKEFNLREWIMARAEFEARYLVGIVTDESPTEDIVTSSLASFAKKIEWVLNEQPTANQTFYTVSKQKILRDYVYGNRDTRLTDDSFFKKHNMYDFPSVHLDFGKSIFSNLFQKDVISKKIIELSNLNQKLLRKYEETLKNN